MIHTTTTSYTLVSSLLSLKKTSYVTKVKVKGFKSFTLKFSTDYEVTKENFLEFVCEKILLVLIKADRGSRLNKLYHSVRVDQYAISMLKAFEKNCEHSFIGDLRRYILDSFKGEVKPFTVCIWSTLDVLKERYVLYDAAVTARTKFEAKFLLFDECLDSRWFTTSTVEEVTEPKVLLIRKD